MDGLVELPAVGGELLDARPALHVPQADGAVVTWNRPQRGGERSSHQKTRPSHVKGHGSERSGLISDAVGLYSLPDIRYSPFGSTARQVTASR